MPTQEKRLSQNIKGPGMLNPYPTSHVSCEYVSGNKEICLGLRLGLVQHPSEQVDLGNDGQWLHRTTCILLGHNRSAVPLEEAVQDAERGIHRDFDKAATPGPGLEGVYPLGQITGVGNHLGDL